MAREKWYQVMNFNVCLHWNQLESFSLLRRQPNDLSLSLAFKTNDFNIIFANETEATEAMGASRDENNFNRYL